jgi:hypothetical protein
LFKFQTKGRNKSTQSWLNAFFRLEGLYHCLITHVGKNSFNGNHSQRQQEADTQARLEVLEEEYRWLHGQD